MLVELRLIKRQTRIFMSSKNSKSYFTQKKNTFTNPFQLQPYTETYGKSMERSVTEE